MAAAYIAHGRVAEIGMAPLHFWPSSSISSFRRRPSPVEPLRLAAIMQLAAAGGLYGEALALGWRRRQLLRPEALGPGLNGGSSAALPARNGLCRLSASKSRKLSIRRLAAIISAS